MHTADITLHGFIQIMQVIIQGICSVETSSLTTAKQYAFGFETASLELGGVLPRVSLNFF